MCSGSEAGSYLRLIDFVHHLTHKKKKKNGVSGCGFRVLHIRAPVVATCEDRVLDGPASGEKGSRGRN